MKYTYYANSSFMGNLLADYFMIEADKPCRLVDSHKNSFDEPWHLVSKEEIMSIDLTNTEEILWGDWEEYGNDTLIIVDSQRYQERTWIPQLAVNSTIYYFMELQWQGRNLETIDRIKSEYPQIQHFIGVKNHPPGHDDTDWDSWQKLEPDFNYPTIEISRLSLSMDLAMYITTQNLSFGEYMEECPDRKERREIERWLKKNSNRLAKIGIATS